MTEKYQPLPEWATDLRQARLTEDGGLELVTTNETDAADFVTSWTGRTAPFDTNPDGTRKAEDLAHQPDEIHRPVLELSADMDPGRFHLLLSGVLEFLAAETSADLDGTSGEFRRVGGVHQLFIDLELRGPAYLSLLEVLDAADYLAPNVLEQAYAEGFTAARLRPEVPTERPGVEAV